MSELSSNESFIEDAADLGRRKGRPDQDRGVQPSVATSAPTATPIGHKDTTTAFPAALPRSMHNWLHRGCEVCPHRSATPTSIAVSTLAAVVRDDQQDHGETA